jgi:hypothetical protein
LEQHALDLKITLQFLLALQVQCLLHFEHLQEREPREKERALDKEQKHDSPNGVWLDSTILHGHIDTRITYRLPLLIRIKGKALVHNFGDIANETVTKYLLT